jgi:Zn-dependent membrane protease YugP/Tfp pilus assembly protein PilF
MGFGDFIEVFDDWMLPLLVALGLLWGAGLVQRTTRRFQRVSKRLGFGVSSCGLTGHHAALWLLKGCGLDDVAVVATTGRDLYDPRKREVQLGIANYTGQSLAALAIAGHEVGHAQQFASNRSLYLLRLTCLRLCQGLAVAGLLLVLGATMLPVRYLLSVLLVLTTLVVVLQAGITLPLERDASRRARGLVRKEGLITPAEAAGFDQLLNAAWLTYAAAGARRGIGLLLVAFLTIVLTWRLVPNPASSDIPGPAFLLPGAGSPTAPVSGMLIIVTRLIPLLVIGLVFVGRYRRVRPSRAQRGLAQNTAATAEYAHGDYAAAVKHLDAAIALLPPTAALHFNRGSAYLGMGRRDHALADMDRALALDPKLPQAHRTRGNLCLEKGDYDSALRDFDAAVEFAATDAAAWRDRGLTFLWRGDYDRALADLNESIRLEKTDAVAFNNRGVVHLRRHEFEQARADLLEAIRLNPDFSNPRKHLASLEETCRSSLDAGLGRPAGSESRHDIPHEASSGLAPDTNRDD